MDRLQQSSHQNTYGDTIVNDSSFIQGNVQNLYQSNFSLEQSCHQVFKTSDYESHKFLIVARAPGTCKWVLDHPQYLRWLQKCSHDVLWLSANPGQGKSVLVKALVDHDLKDQVDTTICYFFFKKGNTEQDNLANALSAILHQLFKSKPHLLRYAIQEWQAVGDRIRQEVSVMWKVLLTASTDPLTGTVICVIDALDECRADDLEFFIRLICDFYSKMTGWAGKLKFLLTSQPIEEIEACFERNLPPETMLRFRGEEESDSLLEETQLVVRRGVEKLAAMYDLESDHKDTLLRQFSEMKQRTYLWWSLALHDIHMAFKESPDPRTLRIPPLPLSVEESYERMLANIEPHVRITATMVFAIIIGSFRPLTLDEMALALEILSTCGISRNPVQNFSGAQLRRRVRQWCSHMICVSRSRLHFIHGTARDFLIAEDNFISNTQRVFEKWKHSISYEFAIKAMTLLCHKLKQDHHINTYNRFSQFYRDGDAARLAAYKSLLSHAAGYVNAYTAAAMKLASFHRSVFLMHRLSSFGIDLQLTDSDGKSLLHHLLCPPASLGDNVVDESLIKLILDRGGLVRSADDDNMNCLQYAVVSNRLDLINLLLDTGFPINSVVKRERMQTRRAKVFSVSEEHVRDKGRNANGLTAVHAAALSFLPVALSVLIQRGANVSAVDTDGQTALHLVISGGPRRDFRRNDYWTSAMTLETYNQRQLWREQHTIRHRDAARIPEVVRKLCDESPNLVFAQDKWGRTPLHLLRYLLDEVDACKVASTLLAFGACPKIRDIFDITPIHTAARFGSVERLKLLVPPDAIDDLSMACKWRINVLHFAALNENDEVIVYILDRMQSASLYAHYVDYRGFNALHRLLFGQYVYSEKRIANKVSILLAAGVRADCLNHHGYDALAVYLVCGLWCVESNVVKTLLGHGGDPSFQDSEGNNLAHYHAAHCREIDFETLLVLEDWGLDLCASNAKCSTVAHFAARRGNMTPEILNHLIHCRGADVSAQDHLGISALEYAEDTFPPGLLKPGAHKISQESFRSAPLSRQNCRCESFLKRGHQNSLARQTRSLNLETQPRQSKCEARSDLPRAMMTDFSTQPGLKELMKKKGINLAGQREFPRKKRNRVSTLW